MTLADQDRRSRLLIDLDTTLLVEAAAGTGKTSLLAGRIAMLLAAGREPKHIAAITFTELAASELAHRIRITVDDLLSGNIPRVLIPVLSGGLSVAQQMALRAAAERLDELTATTIHGFCQTIVRIHAIAASLDPGSKVIDAVAADTMFAACFSNWLKQRLSRTSAEPDDPIAILSKDEPLAIVALLKELAELRRDHPNARTSPLVSGRPDIEFVQAVDDFARWHAASPGDAGTAQLIADLQALVTFFSDTFAGACSFATLWKRARPPRVKSMKKESFELLAYRRGTAWKAAHGTNAGERLCQEAETHFDRVDITYRVLVGAIAQALVNAVSASLDDLLTGYRDQKRAAAVLDFDDLLHHARDLVVQHEDVRQSLGRRYRHLLVDEFQDTDPVQAEILFLIGASVRPTQWHDAVLRQGSLFLVGDPKQAIYRFRGADIDIYHRARSNIKGPSNGEIVEIIANFRSQVAIIDHVNACFSPVLSRADQPGYVALAPTIPTSDSALPRITKVTIQVPPGESATGQREAEAEAVAEICHQLIGAIHITRADGSRSPLRPGDIALLAPTSTDLWRYERALEAKRISVASQAGKTLLLRQETQDILALLRTLANPLDTLAFGALMRGPLVGLTDNELLDITSALPEGDQPVGFSMLTAPETVQHALAKSVLGILQRLRRRGPITTPMLLLSDAVEELQVRIVLAARHRDKSARAIANLDALIERARPYAVSGLQTFVEDLQRDWEQKIRVPEGRSDISEDAIELVTMHSAKGLEWPVVIPINTATRFFSSNQFVHRRSDDTLHWVMGGIAPPDLAAARADENTSEANQRARIWYVACTRARDLLVLPHLPSSDTRSWARTMDLQHSSLPELDLSALPRPSMMVHPVVRNEQTAERFAQEAERVSTSSPVIKWRRPSDTDPDRPVIIEVPTAASSDLTEVSLVTGAGRVRGIILHKLMEELLTAELLGDEAAVISRAAVLLDQLSSPDETHLPEPREMGRTAFRTLSLPEVADLRPYLVPEIPVWSHSGIEHLAARADALAVQNDEVTTVLDWKSDINPSAIDRAHHLDQIGDYKAATGAGRAGVVYMTLGEIVWL